LFKIPRSSWVVCIGFLALRFVGFVNFYEPNVTIL
jgi:hypothetical protein